MFRRLRWTFKPVHFIKCTFLDEILFTTSGNHTCGNNLSSDLVIRCLSCGHANQFLLSLMVTRAICSDMHVLNVTWIKVLLITSINHRLLLCWRIIMHWWYVKGKPAETLKTYLDYTLLLKSLKEMKKIMSLNKCMD